MADIKKKLLIERNNQRQEITELLKCTFLGLEVSSPQPSTDYVQITGLDGRADGYTTFGSKTASAKFFFKSKDVQDYQLVIRDVWGMFFTREAYYISSSEMPGLRYLVHPKPFDYARLNVVAGEFTIEFDVFKGHAESTFTTLSLEEEEWQIGNDLPVGKDLNYVFNVSSFQIYNGSDITINPLLRHGLTIAVAGKGSPTITNKTTGDVFKYNNNLLSTDILNITGVYPYINGTHCGRDTNHGLITLAPGWNVFRITGLDEFRISFDFPFLYINK